MIHEDERLKIRIAKIDGKTELILDYYEAGMYAGSVITRDLYDMNAITLEPFAG